MDSGRTAATPAAGSTPQDGASALWATLGWRQRAELTLPGVIIGIVGGLIVGAFSVAYGVVLIMLGVRLRKWVRNVEHLAHGVPAAGH